MRAKPVTGSAGGAGDGGAGGGGGGNGPAPFMYSVAPLVCRCVQSLLSQRSLWHMHLGSAVQRLWSCSMVAPRCSAMLQLPPCAQASVCGRATYPAPSPRIVRGDAATTTRPDSTIGTPSTVTFSQGPCRPCCLGRAQARRAWVGLQSSRCPARRRPPMGTAAAAARRGQRRRQRRARRSGSPPRRRRGPASVRRLLHSVTAAARVRLAVSAVAPDVTGPLPVPTG